MCFCLIFFTVYSSRFFFFFFNDTATTEIYTLSLHDALPILLNVTPMICPNLPCWISNYQRWMDWKYYAASAQINARSEEHTSELQSQSNLVCRLLLEKKKKKTHRTHSEMYT